MSAQDGDSPQMNASHIDAGVLADYWAAALASSDEEAVEEHLFGCGECTGRLQQVIALADGVRRLAQEGSLRMVISDAFLTRAAEDGLRVRQYTPPEGGAVACTVTPEDDLLIARFAADLSGSKQIDLSLCDERGTEQVRLPDIPVDASAGLVVYQESITFAKALPTTTLIARLVSVDESGTERPLGEYTFNHTRSMPDATG